MATAYFQRWLSDTSDEDICKILLAVKELLNYVIEGEEGGGGNENS